MQANAESFTSDGIPCASDRASCGKGPKQRAEREAIFHTRVPLSHTPPPFSKVARAAGGPQERLEEKKRGGGRKLPFDVFWWRIPN
ncbi:hypothetical protein CDAR_395131 [Caerostris darwini]|uniref:Uncharacterized protein n=1 Tax=Caerostris darwini TaxID=1538125 RepID=A0AAV4QBE3_9ARAC|nr:hypothetical protein CDAR_395131 [Caerostris darwini]